MKNHNRVYTVTILMVIILLSTVACNNTQQPNITIEAHVLELTEKEYNSIGTHELENSIKDDFRKFKLKFEMEYSNRIADRKIDFPDGTDWANIISKERYRFGSGRKYIPNDKGDAVFYREFIFYSKGLSEEEIKSAFDSTIIEVFWVSKEGKPIKKEYVISNLVEFDKENKKS
ncbi:fructose-bisphosphate aldolase [Alkalihalobacillus deserti]|uniref:fructose-bisphosphate aldolase n=1 Tax=Alkalihalobacillus deserti TaxID=2879466 RepID=UPI001D150E96|nr:fructose-bisphosphate aldolase [Alkalihalobacillus deserti]